MKNKDHLPFTVPDGYFESLTERVMQRCGEREATQGQRLSLWGSVRAQLAFAAGFALLVGLSYMAARYAPTLLQSATDVASEAYYDISIMDLESYLLEGSDSSDDDLDDEAIVEYLICDNQMQMADYN
ncbi:MAG: hypothetical protein LBB79_05525 [Prevotellaceae bacterium]|jgi:hypothetical protein|nr:hypothetical protein [Prevotellaceae bacterium]